MKLNKEDFLNSELGSNLLECIESWDWALRGGVKTKPLADWCQAQWEVYQIMFRRIFSKHLTCSDGESAMAHTPPSLVLLVD